MEYSKQWLQDVPRMIDISCVKANSTWEDVQQAIEAAKKYRFICVFSMPFFTRRVVEALVDEPDIITGGTTGFPSGADLTEAKVLQAREFVKMGCSEIDMVIQVGAFLSGEYDLVADDIRRVVDAAEGLPVKTIIEAPYLTLDQVKKASEIAAASGASFVKTSTGWPGVKTTPEVIRAIKSVVGNDLKIKAAGGIRDLATIQALASEGCSRFGLGLPGAMKVIEEIQQIL